MSLKDDFVKTIKSAKEERSSRLQDESTFNADWKSKKNGVVRSALEAAAAALVEEEIGGQVDTHNGAILLLAGKATTPSRGASPYQLSFRPDLEKLEIIYSSTVPEFAGDSVSPKALSEILVNNIVREFLSLVVSAL